MKRRLLMIGFVVVVVFLIIILLPTFLPKEEVVDADVKNTEIYYELLKLGIEDAVVDVTEDRILIRYNEVENIEMHEIVRVSAEAFPESEKIIIQKFIDFEPKEQIEINVNDAIDFIDGNISKEDMFGKAIVSTLG